MEASHVLREGRRAAVAERRRLLVVELGQLRLERKVDPTRAVLDRKNRLGRERLELRRQLPRILRERPLGIDVGDHLPQLLDLDAELRVASLRLLLDALEPALDLAPGGD